MAWSVMLYRQDTIFLNYHLTNQRILLAMDDRATGVVCKTQITLFIGFNIY